MSSYNGRETSIWLENVWDYYWYANGGAKNLEKSSLEFEGKHNAGDVTLEVAAEDFCLELGQSRSIRELMLI